MPDVLWSSKIKKLSITKTKMKGKKSITELDVYVLHLRKGYTGRGKILDREESKNLHDYTQALHRLKERNNLYGHSRVRLP